MMSEATSYRLSDVIEIIGGGTPKKKVSEYWSGDIPWLSVVDFNSDERFVDNTAEKITELGLQESSTKLLEAGQVIISARGTVGCLAQLTVPMAFNQSCYGLSGKSGVLDNDYLYYLMRVKVAELQQKTHGAVFDTITRETFNHIEVKIPALSTQKVIAKVLGSFDYKIQLNNQINQTLEQMAQAIFKSWFVDFEPVKAKMAALEAGGSEDDALLAAMQAIAGNALFASNAADADAATQLARLQAEHPEQYATLRATAELFPSAMQESELGEIPEGWGTGSFKDLCLTVESGGTPKRNTPEYWGGKIKWLASGEVRDVVVLDTKETITESGLKNSSAKLWPMYTTVVAMYGATAGQVCLIADQMTSNQACCGLIPKKNYKAFTFFSAKRSIQSLSDKASGSAQQNLNKGLVEGHQTILPAETILVVYEELAFPLMLKWIENMRESVMLAETRDTLLPKLLSGELSVSAATDQITQAEEAIDV